MGKRELVIIGAFAILGMIAYQLTAPAPKPGERRFSWSAVVDTWRNPPRNRAQAQVTREGSVPLSAATTEISISGASTVVVIGETRTNVVWSLLVQTSGPEESAAQAAAEGVTLVADDMGSVLALVAEAPRAARAATTLTVRAPHGLALRLDAARRATISGMASVRLDGALGDVEIRDVAGLVSGGHRNGSLTLVNAGAANLNLTGSNATLTGVRGDTQVTARNGSTRVHDGVGPVTIDSSTGLVEILRAHEAVRVTTSGGTVRISQPRATVRVDARNVALTIELDAPVPVTAMAVEGSLHLSLERDLPIALDAVADRSTIVATELGVTPVPTARGVELHHTFGSAARVALRSDGGEIEITHRK